jgi:large subunit ribosomal protein L19
MDTKILKTVEKEYYRNDPYSFKVGDTIAVHNLIREGDKTRTQIFKGVVIAKKNSGLRSTFTVRKISDGIGVEKIFPLHSPNVENIEVLKEGKVRKSKLYYMRKRIGRAAVKVKAKKSEK